MLRDRASIASSSARRRTRSACSCARRGPRARRAGTASRCTGITPIRSAIGSPSVLERLHPARGPSSGSPAWTATTATTACRATSSGRNGAGGAVVRFTSVVISSGSRGDPVAVEAQDLLGAVARVEDRAAETIGPTGCRRNSSDVAMPKLPPPPRRPQSSSGFSSSLARTSRPSAVTTSARDQVVAGQAVLAHQPADAAAEREARRCRWSRPGRR